METRFACRSNRYCAWMIESSRKGTYYLVEFDFAAYGGNDFREGWYCECPAFHYRDKELCKHIKNVKARKCDWDQAQQTETSTAVVRKKTGELLCPVCEGDVYAYAVPESEETPF